MDKEQIELEARTLLFQTISKHPPLLVIVKDVNLVKEDKGKYYMRSVLTILTEDDAIIGDADFHFAMPSEPSVLRKHINALIPCASQMKRTKH